MGPVGIHLTRLRERIGDFETQEVPGNGCIVRIPNVALPVGWSKQQTQVTLVAPEGYPFAKPDCFWTDVDLRLANGALPKNSQLNNPIPGYGGNHLWFSWHVDPWNPNQNDLITWFTLIKRRLAQPQ